jgi:fatty-acyl-CoA synthase
MMSGMTDAAVPWQEVLPEIADAALLGRPLRSIADVEAIEQTPLDERLTVVDFSQRISLALAARKPEDTAIFFVPDGDVDHAPEQVSFGDLRQNIDRVAALLRANGIERTDVVAILLPAIPQIYWAILGSIATAVAFPLNWMLEPPALLHLLKQANAKAVIALGPTPGFRIWESLMSIADALPMNTPIWSVVGPQGVRLPATDLDAQIAGQRNCESYQSKVKGDDIAAYVHSGGTTGMPKIVKLSHRNMSYRHWTLQLASNLFLGEVILHDTPMFHVGGLIGRCLPPLASGASVLIPSVMGARDKRYISNYWKFVEKYRVTRLSGVPTTLAVLAKSPPEQTDLSSLASCFITGSTALPASVRQEFERVSGVRVLNSYGMTENTASIAIDPRDGPRKDGSSGIRLPYTQIRVVALNDQSGAVRLCDADEVGMLQIKGPGNAQGYVDASHAAGSRTEDGWLITGDLGRVDADGYVFVTGRAKDVIIRGGHNIDPALIEEPLLQRPDVLHAAAVGKPDSYAGELPVAYVQLVQGSRTTAEDLVAYLRGCIAERAAAPKEIIIVEKLPLTDVGKPIKAELRRDSAERAFRAELSQTTGLCTESGELEVSARPHPTFGVIIAIVMTDVPAAMRTELAARVAEAMGRYAFAHTVEWR